MALVAAGTESTLPPIVHGTPPGSLVARGAPGCSADLSEDDRTSRTLVPPFTAETAAQRLQAAEDAWNTRDLETVATVRTPDT